MIVPRYYQEEAVNAIFEYFGSKSGNPIVALPTATGKSVVIARFLERAFYYYPGTRALMLTHVKELIEQNAQKIGQMWPDAKIGIYSSGLGRHEFMAPIVFGGVASVRNVVEKFGFRDFILVDECHLISPHEDTMYQEVIAALRTINPKLKVIGFTATAYRMKQGMLTDEGIFTDICYDRTRREDFGRFIAEGFLVPLIPQPTETVIDVSDVASRGGEFIQGELEAAVDKPTITQQAMREVCQKGQDRRAWLVFSTGVTHAEHCAEQLNLWGIKSAAVHAKLKKRERDAILSDFKAGRLRCVTNNNVLTTGFDHPEIDLIGMARPTKSPSLWVQMLGRGMRPAPWVHKRNCLVLDFAGNSMRLGPVDDPMIPGRPRPNGSTDAPVKICEACSMFNHTSARYCDNCGAEFPTRENLVSQSSTIPLLSSELPVVTYFKVDSVNYHDWISKKGNRSVRVSYHCGIRSFYEYISFGGPGSLDATAREWWYGRSPWQAPPDVASALPWMQTLRIPSGIKVWINQRYPQVVAYEWN